MKLWLPITHQREGNARPVLCVASASGSHIRALAQRMVAMSLNQHAMVVGTHNGRFIWCEETDFPDEVVNRYLYATSIPERVWPAAYRKNEDMRKAETT